MLKRDVGDGSVSTSSPDLELVSDGGDQLIGIRFQDLDIPQGATVLGASLELDFDDDDSGNNSTAISLTVKGEDADDADGFSTSTNDISNRLTTSASVSWSLDPFVSGNSMTSPDLTTIIQEIVNRTGWTEGNDLATYPGKR